MRSCKKYLIGGLLITLVAGAVVGIIKAIKSKDDELEFDSDDADDLEEDVNWEDNLDFEEDDSGEVYDEVDKLTKELDDLLEQVCGVTRDEVIKTILDNTELCGFQLESMSDAELADRYAKIKG